MKKARLILILISNMFMLSIAPLLKIVGMNSIVKCIINQAIRSTDYIEECLGGNNNE